MTNAKVSEESQKSWIVDDILMSVKDMITNFFDIIANIAYIYISIIEFISIF